ncbi:MAG: hypothetical protein IJK58_04050 [Clostridia bacterium]|nr:hypothetical protein [Clostridia bacterium]
MKKQTGLRVMVFIHALAVVLLQFIPNAIITASAVNGGKMVYSAYSFIYDFGHLWGSGSLWYPALTVLSVVTLCFAVFLLIRGREWSKIAVLVTSVLSILLLLIPIVIMISDPNRISIVQIAIIALLISEMIFTAVSVKWRA